MPDVEVRGVRSQLAEQRDEGLLFVRAEGARPLLFPCVVRLEGSGDRMQAGLGEPSWTARPS